MVVPRFWDLMNLKMKNYELEIRKRGTSMKRMQLSKVTKYLQAEILGHPILYFSELTSTNEIAKELAVRGAREGTAILAETQTTGKGRLGRRWISPEGGLWLSIIFRPKIEAKHAPKLTLMASVAVAKTINGIFQSDAQIKWPNDVVINHKKVCGVLTDAKTDAEKLDFVVVGVGINANFNLDVLPTYIRDRSTTLKEELGREIERETLLRELLEQFEFYYKLFTERKFDTILKEWRGLSSFLGSRVNVVSGNESIEGLAIDIDEDGALIVKLKDRTIRKVTVGEITIIEGEYTRCVDE